MEKRNQASVGIPTDVKTLVKKASEGSQDAFEELKFRYKPLLEKAVTAHTRYDMTAQDVSDLREEALLIFCNAVCNYDCSAEGVEFGLYAKICIENGLVSFVRAFSRRKRKMTLPLEEAKDTDREQYDPLQEVVDKERLSELVAFIRSHLSEYENRIWWMYTSGMSVSQISDMLGNADPKSVSNAVYRIRKKLRVFMASRRDNE